MINLFYEISNFQLKNEYLFIHKIYFLLKNENKIVGDINYIFCDDNILLDLNNKYLKKNYYTDVIAFDYSIKNIISGDIYISIDRVLENSNNWNQFFITELKRVMIHAILHFLGYKDHKKQDKIIMEKKENYYLKIF